MEDHKAECDCCYCKTRQIMPYKYVGPLLGTKYYVCPSCNASNSPNRVQQDIEKGKAKKV